ncbi:MAG: RsmB/NOP family class I SAM-dependent RNA methyltransferase [Lachnospiraceae bacterium]|nr:RsmB/NOP family class I SAM-dependent RNA methyltransferase [Lachnospiraceae bacterium]
MNLPEEFENRMKTLMGDEYEAFAGAFAKEGEAKGLRFSFSRLPKPAGETNESGNAGAVIPENVISEFTDGAVPWSGSGFYVKENSFPGKSIYHEAGAFYLQEPSAMVAAALADVKPGEKVLDLCAAPGGKSTALGDALRGEGILVSNEIHPARVKILSENIERMGISNALVLNETPEKIAELFPEFFDCVVVDAPCSGEGMFRKEEAALTEWSPENVEMCAFRQREILKEAVKCVSPGGRLVYSTCTFAPAEDEENIAWILSEYPDFHTAGIPEDIRKAVSPGRPEWCGKTLSSSEEENTARSIRNCVRIWPHLQKGEGHFAAVLVRDDLPQNPDNTDFPKEIEKQEEGFAVRGEEKTAGEKSGNSKRKNVRNFEKERGKNIALSREMRESFGLFEKESLTEKGRRNFTEVTTYSPKDQRVAALFGDNLYIEPFYFSGKGVRIERAGLHVGTFAKNRFEPSLALARTLGAEDVKCTLALTQEQEDKALSYFRGEQLYGIPADLKGWTLVTYEGYSLGFGKASNGVLKNHYPKGLRIKG